MTDLTVLEREHAPEGAANERLPSARECLLDVDALWPHLEEVLSELADVAWCAEFLLSKGNPSAFVAIDRLKDLTERVREIVERIAPRLEKAAASALGRQIGEERARRS
jgi:hypothetical protein